MPSEAVPLSQPPFFCVNDADELNVMDRILRHVRESLTDSAVVFRSDENDDESDGLKLPAVNEMRDKTPYSASCGAKVAERADEMNLSVNFRLVPYFTLVSGVLSVSFCFDCTSAEHPAERAGCRPDGKRHVY